MKSHNLKSGLIALTAAAVGALGASLASEIVASRDAARRTTIRGMLSQVLTRIDAHLTAHGELPFSDVAALDGEASKSWRVKLHLDDQLQSDVAPDPSKHLVPLAAPIWLRIPSDTMSPELTRFVVVRFSNNRFMVLLLSPEEGVPWKGYDEFTESDLNDMIASLSGGESLYFITEGRCVGEIGRYNVAVSSQSEQVLSQMVSRVVELGAGRVVHPE